MTWIDRRLSAALAGSLLFHLLLLSPGFPPVPAPRPPAALEVRLAAALPREQPALLPPEPPRPETAPRPAKPKPPAPPRPPKAAPAKAAPAKPAAAATDWTASARRQIRELDRQGKLYPLEAIARGLEGEALVLFVLDESGTVVAARIEQSSGHKILDEAALRAIYTLRSLPAEAPRQGVYPVRFRLK